jgi:hypothetical protein
LPFNFGDLWQFWHFWQFPDQCHPRSSAVRFCFSDYGDDRGPQIGPFLPGWGGMTRDDGDSGDFSDPR